METRMFDNQLPKVKERNHRFLWASTLGCTRHRTKKSIRVCLWKSLKQRGNGIVRRN